MTRAGDPRRTQQQESDECSGSPSRPPSFAVVIPAWRAAETVAGAIESALGQTYPASEVIVVDDRSPDNQAEIVSRYAHSVVQVTRRSNGGTAAANNAGVAATSADWVVLLGADDAFLPTRLERMADYIQMCPEADIVTTDAWIELDGHRLRRYYRGPTGARWAQGDQRLEILDRPFIFGHAAVRRDVWVRHGGMDESDRSVADDWPFWVRLILAGARAGLVDEPLAVYRVRGDSRSNAGATRSARSWRAAMLAGASHPDADPEIRAFAARQAAAAERRLRLLACQGQLWRGERPRACMLSIALDRYQRKRVRLEAALAAITPTLARRRMTRDPEALAWGTAELILG